jgi:hypothetical protein
MTRWNASSAAPPNAAGSVSGPMMSQNSTTEPGQPCVMISGSASGEAERTCRKCTRAPSIVVVNWANPFSRASCARQSYSSRQYDASSRT